MSFLKLLIADPKTAAEQANTALSEFFDHLEPNAKALLPLLVNAATIAEVAAGAPEAIPLTRAAGASAQQLIDLGAHHESLAASVNQLSGIATSIAASTGNPDVINQVNEAVNKTASPLSAIGSIIQSLKL